MPTEIAISTEDRPGVLAELGELFGEIGVNITAAAAFTHQGAGHLHFVVDEAVNAVKQLKARGYEVLSVHEVIAVSLDDRPGELGRFARRLADSGINVKSFYTAGAGAGDKEIIVAVDDIEAARKFS